MSGEKVRYLFDLRYPDSRKARLSYEVEGARDGAVARNFDGALCATVLHAMRERLDIRLHGPATATALRNLREFQTAWSRWLPDRYRPIEIEADDVVDPPLTRPFHSIAALSGGVDATFTLLRHNMTGHHGEHRLSAVLMVHGFDVGLANRAHFEQLVERTREIRERLGVELRVVRTNSKELRMQSWEDSFAAELAACMHFCSGEFSEGLIGSSEPYDALVLPWGSNPVTDHLLSGGALTVTHDGAGFSRTEKVVYLARSPAAVRALKVCWEGEHQARNCGECEKCVRTQLNFLAVGVSDPACFDRPLDLRRIAAIRIRTEAQLAEFRSICQFAERNDIDAEWLRLLRARLRRGKDRSVREVARTTLARLGLLEFARQVRGRIG